MLTLSVSAVSNRLLQALPKSELNAVSIFLEEVNIDCGEVLYYSGEPAEYVYFPEDSLISIMTSFENGGMVEQACIGAEGILGAELCLSNTISTGEAVARLGGRALRMKSDQFCRLLSQVPVFEKLVKEYLLVLMKQISQTGACNRFHFINARLAKLLLSYLDRTGNVRFQLTQENMSEILGSARPMVSEAAAQFREKNLITYARGAVSILNRPGLAAEACECYKISCRIYEYYELLLKNNSVSAAANQKSYSPAVKRNYYPNALAEIV